MNALVARCRRRLATDDRGSLPMAMLLIVVGLSLSGLLATYVTNQLSATRTVSQRSDSLDAAQTGLDVALGHIRTAVTSGSGDATKLPCGPWNGAVSTGTKQTYAVTLYYLSSAPTPGNLTWANANKLPCTSGSNYGGTPVPVYVFLASLGKSGTTDSGRTIYATYTLHSKSRDNVAGGLIPLYTDSTKCLSAPSSTPAAGDPVTIQTCDQTNGAELFAYAGNLNLILVSSQANGSTGMCLDAGPNNNEQVLFQPCSSTTIARQQWSLNDRANFEGTTDGVNLNRMCFHLTSPGAVGSTIVLHAVASDPSGVSQQDAACDGDYTSSRSFAPLAAAGSGRAGTDTSQLVNFSQFGRCLDVTANDVTQPFEVIWPCKQKPSGAIQWNQVWNQYDVTTGSSSALGKNTVTGQIYTTTNSKNYCLTSPGSTASSQYVVVQQCTLSTSPAASQSWTRQGATGVFTTAYRIESTYGAPSGTTYCLQPTDPAASPQDFWAGHGDVSKSVIRVCDSGSLQKWNASTMILQSSLTDVSEK